MEKFMQIEECVSVTFFFLFFDSLCIMHYVESLTLNYGILVFVYLVLLNL